MGEKPDGYGQEKPNDGHGRPDKSDYEKMEGYDDKHNNQKPDENNHDKDVRDYASEMKHLDFSSKTDEDLYKIIYELKLRNIAFERKLNYMMDALAPTIAKTVKGVLEESGCGCKDRPDGHKPEDGHDKDDKPDMGNGPEPDKESEHNKEGEKDKEHTDDKPNKPDGGRPDKDDNEDKPTKPEGERPDKEDEDKPTKPNEEKDDTSGKDETIDENKPSEYKPSNVLSIAKIDHSIK